MVVLGINPGMCKNTRNCGKIPGFVVRNPYSPSKVEYILYFCHSTLTERRDYLLTFRENTENSGFYRKVVNFQGSILLTTGRFLSLGPNSSWTVIYTSEMTAF